MASLNHIVLGILILQIYVYAAPNDVSKLEDIAKVEQAEPAAEQTDPKLDSEPKEVESDDNSTETQRQKRWYNPYGFGYPPFSPFNTPSYNNPSYDNQGYNKRDEGSNAGYYGGQDPLIDIHRRIQEIHRGIINQAQLPPPPPQIPIFYPILLLPPADCNCNNENQNPTTPEPDTTITPNETDGTTPTVVNRWPEMEDQRQNWGFVVNDSDSEEGIDFNRPISFDPIRLNRPMRPPPPVEHGSVQSDSSNQNRPQSEASSTQSPPSSSQPQTTMQPPQTTRQPTQTKPQNTQPPGYPPASGLAPPSRCDSAILSCCHQPQFVYDCFVSQGCPDLSGYGYGPCDPNLILRVIERFQTYYGQRYK